MRHSDVKKLCAKQTLIAISQTNPTAAAAQVKDDLVRHHLSHYIRDKFFS